MNQSEARKTARELRNAVPDGVAPVAVPYPFGCWGGAETGWTIVYVPVTT